MDELYSNFLFRSVLFGGHFDFSEKPLFREHLNDVFLNSFSG